MYVNVQIVHLKVVPAAPVEGNVHAFAVVLLEAHQPVYLKCKYFQVEIYPILNENGNPFFESENLKNGLPTYYDDSERGATLNIKKYSSL